ncbi:MAG: bifunctional aspartate kinase/homoserine dehydrogenase I [Candidatus Riflebacteria bacterium]|nr:bifunctional aspartate kinase/homoserine dehydrogenase I [Candidatus Riflebacteria bacterium]
MKKDRWVVHKFGGTSLGNAERILQVASIIRSTMGKGQNIAVVVSAMSGITDRLLKLASLAEQRDPSFDDHLNALRSDHLKTIETLLPKPLSDELSETIEKDLCTLREILRGVQLLHECSERARDFVAGMGEVWSAQIMNALMNHQGFVSSWIDARQVLVVEHAQPSLNVIWNESLEYLKDKLSVLPLLPDESSHVLIITGFVARTSTGIATVLGRNGSDYTASIFGHLLDAEKVVIWTDVDGVMSADPNKVPEAVLVPELTYREAIELAYFGAKVLHPGTMAPAIAKSLPIVIKNTFRPDEPGSIVKFETSIDRDRPVKGFATIEPIALINMEGTGMMGVPGIAGRLFDALHAEKISVIMISQASSEHSICFAVPAIQGAAAKKAAEMAFSAELMHGKVQTVDIYQPCAILAAVGEGMAGAVGMSARFFGALGAAGVNIRAIAQGSSERNISVVIDARDSIKALRAAHAGFYLSRQALSIGIIGLGNVGSALLDQISREMKRLRDDFQIDLRIRGIMNSKKMHLHERGFDASKWREIFNSDHFSSNIETFVSHILTDSLPHAVIIDCTPSGDFVRLYPDWFKRGLHVITPNKRAGSAPIEDYRNTIDTARRYRRQFLYETTVCAGLPVIGTLRDLVQTGDEILCIEGMFSGTLSYIFSRMSEGKLFSEALRGAMNKGYTEPDPRDDLAGLDIARKVVILAREAGMMIDLDKVHVLNLVPEDLRGVSLDEFLNSLDRMDQYMKSLISGLAVEGHEARYLGIIDPKNGVEIKLASVPADSIFARAVGGNNVVSFRTRRYSANPLIVMGPGAGPEVTAAGVFADLLRLCAYIGGGQ